MKKLSEIKLNDFYEMDEMEMRNIIGGSGSGSGSGGDNNCDSSKCSGDCIITVSGTSVSGTCTMDDVVIGGQKVCACVEN